MGNTDMPQLKNIVVTISGTGIPEMKIHREPNEIISAYKPQELSLAMKLREMENMNTEDLYRNSLNFMKRERESPKPGSKIIQEYLIVGYIPRICLLDAEQFSFGLGSPGRPYNGILGTMEPPRYISWLAGPFPIPIVTPLKKVARPSDLRMFGLIMPRNGLCQPYPVPSDQVFYRYEYRESSTTADTRWLNWMRNISDAIDTTLASRPPRRSPAPTVSSAGDQDRGRLTPPAGRPGDTEAQGCVDPQVTLIGDAKSIAEMLHSQTQPGFLKEVEDIIREINQTDLVPSAEKKGLIDFVSPQTQMTDTIAAEVKTDIESSWPLIGPVTIETIQKLWDLMHKHEVKVRYDHLHGFFLYVLFRLEQETFEEDGDVKILLGGGLAFGEKMASPRKAEIERDISCEAAATICIFTQVLRLRQSCLHLDQHVANWRPSPAVSASLKRVVYRINPDFTIEASLKTAKDTFFEEAVRFVRHARKLQKDVDTLLKEAVQMTIKYL